MNLLTLKLQIRKLRYKLSWLYNAVLVTEGISVLRFIVIQGVQITCKQNMLYLFFSFYSFFTAISPRAGRDRPVLEWSCWWDFESSHCSSSSCEPVKSPST